MTKHATHHATPHQDAQDATQGAGGGVVWVGEAKGGKGHVSNRKRRIEMSIEDKLTRLHREAVRIRHDGMCFVPCCGHGCDTAHLVSKGSNPHWMWEYENGVLACRIHHGWLDGQSSISKKHLMQHTIEMHYQWQHAWMIEHQNKPSSPWTQTQLEEKVEELKAYIIVLRNVAPAFRSALRIEQGKISVCKGDAFDGRPRALRVMA